ncbi:MAG: hypothetical protein UX44_C0001G0030 [candidate division WWE3 bacterium GW2011_GWA1_46_21]|uniref:Nucleoid-associated protein n=4 Tax=Katanobacteria TaxID=422282 RepID=A0A0G1SFT0_UNCKA|nr:MAG: hypothetical protein UX44_C0001G0030 [candidate division WWE3 bacterium GW2011_GWA1_46_21]KKU49149.1 MAG: hypothetical protein UX69_C0005G0009 [candidate division WWE3 bacterium GW2011_GWA2_46_9]KKU50860.1 MAG: hypothetical protein UX73_C0012G0005 [candidate division WWE3 bacterium GW2011_GWC1_47_10]KKU58136.1 MAG: hypothetical protein UX79_C0001G0032 [candidate division WWE3 bacterium GW2011_GWB1_47_11]
MLNPQQIFKFKKAQSQIKKQLEQIFAQIDKGNISVLVRGDKKIEKIAVDGEERKDIKEAVNEAIKEAEKKAEKQMRGQSEELMGLFR